MGLEWRVGCIHFIIIDDRSPLPTMKWPKTRTSIDANASMTGRAESGGMVVRQDHRCYVVGQIIFGK